MRCSLLLLLIFLSCVHAGLWLTIPSANDGCGSLTSDSYYWDTEDTNNVNDWSGTIPRGEYNSNIRQYFCTGNVDSMPLGSYCFYQNRQNGNFHLFVYLLLYLITE